MLAKAWKMNDCSLSSTRHFSRRLGVIFACKFGTRLYTSQVKSQVKCIVSI